MRRIVLDTNCLLQSLPSNSPYHKIWSDVLNGQIQLCVNTEILNEYEEILAAKTTKEIASIGPRIVEPHSTSERVELSTIEDIWKVLIELLKRL